MALIIITSLLRNKTVYSIKHFIVLNHYRCVRILYKTLRSIWY